MKKIVLFSLIIGIIFLANISAAAISVSVSPSSAPANTATGFTFGTQAASAGGSVQFKIFNDFNNSGTIDANEWPMLNMVLTDNGQGWNGEEYLAADSNSSSPNITTVWNLSKCNAAYLPVGNYIIQVKNAFSEIATAQFSVTPAFAPQTVTGIVFEEGTSNPIPNALCDCEYINGDDIVSLAFTDSNGSYTLQIPSPGNVDIDCYKYGYTEDDAPPLSVPVGGITNFNLNLKPADAQITGIVTDSGTGNPVWGAEIWAEVLSDWDNETWTTTNFDGSFTLPVLTGGVEIGVEKYGYMDTANNLNVPAVGVPSYNISLVPASTQITGIVTELGTGAPICGAEVWVDTDEGGSWNETGADGSFILLVTPGERTICVEKGGYMPACPNLTVPVGGISGYNLSLQPLDTQITGTVTDKLTGDPIPGVNVWANQFNSGGWSQAVSDNNGDYILPVLSGIEWSVTIHEIPGYFNIEVQNTLITPSTTVPNVVSFTAYKATAWLDVTVLDEYGTKAVEDAFVYGITQSGTPSLFSSGDTDSSGQVSVGLVPGREWLYDAINWSTFVDGQPREMVRDSKGLTYNPAVAGERNPVTLNLYYADGAIEGRVYVLDGVTPAPESTWVSASTSDAKNGTLQISVGRLSGNGAYTDANGYYRLALLSGTWSISAYNYDEGKGSDIQQVMLITDGNDVIDQPGEVITGIDLIINLDIFNPNPIPDIKANGSDGPVGINTNVNLSVTVEFDSGGRTGEDADWWVVADTPFGWFHYDVPTSSWVPELSVTYGGALFDLPTFEVLNMPLPSGIYTFYFGVDMVMNGSLDMGSIYYDSVIVNITE